MPPPVQPAKPTEERDEQIIPPPVRAKKRTTEDPAAEANQAQPDRSYNAIPIDDIDEHPDEPEDIEDPVPVPPKKKKTTDELARETYEVYLERASSGKDLERKMDKCRRAVLRGGIDAEVCSVERFQPFPIRFYTNVSTNCIFFKSFCNEDGQVVYDHGNRNTDTTCRCDYRRGYTFLVSPKNPCFCKPSQEDCSCYLKTCLNTSRILSPEYLCMYKTDLTQVTHCRPLTDETYTIRKRPEIVRNVLKEDNISSLEPRNTYLELYVIFIFGGAIVVFLLVLFVRWLRKYCLSSQEDSIPVE
ncbi:uncharacterized protein LOC143061987 [Mytilus galloprovincialis]|uniref:uncharacterized protein LOC143061987 n=1 Tax=Mytilus galloprovincialis TaxID=29158 RepID=UPI003F7BC22B